MARILTCGCLLLLAACTGTRPSEEIDAPQSISSPSAPSARSTAELRVKFENLLAGKLFHLAVEDIQATSSNERFDTINTHYKKLNATLNPAVLSSNNQQQLRLFNYLWEVERQKLERFDQQKRRSDLSPTEYWIYLPQGGTVSSDVESLSETASENLLNLHEQIRKLTDSDQQTSMFSIFESARHRHGNFLAGTEQGRQDYLTRIINSLLDMQEVLYSYLDISMHKEFIVEGFEDAEDTSVGVIFYDAEFATLRVGMDAMDQLPLFEIESAAFYYGVPGLHSINSVRPPYEVQSLISLPGFEAGWAAYAVSNLDWIPLYQNPESQLGRNYFEAMLISLAIIDMGLHTKNWTPEQAITFALANSPFPEDRLRNYIEQIRHNPGLFSAPLLVSLEIENMKVMSQESLEQRFDLVEFHNTIIETGPLPMAELHYVINQWISEKLPEAETDTQPQ
jgi:hypothetical protein